MHFGEHLTIDGYNGSAKKLNDKHLVLRCLHELPSLIKMRVIAPPQLIVFEGNNSKDPGGVSGVVLIAESHISIHTFPRRRFLTADVYTCKNGLDIKYIIKYFKMKFGLKEIEQHFIKRGTRYPGKNLVSA